MKPLHTFIVTANLPEKLQKLKEIAYNYWWSWDSDGKDLFSRIDWKLWEEVNHNPVLLLNKVAPNRLIELQDQADFLRYLDLIYDRFIKYMESESWYQKEYPNNQGIVAYFSTEYGIHESFPNYSGGLGILSGDHLKSASDLGAPLVAVGLLYQQGYFRQHLLQNGWQTELYLYNDFHSLPLELMKNNHNEPIFISVEFQDSIIFAQIWKLRCGRVCLYLLDTNIPQNLNEEFRHITNQLYGGTRETRIQQEIILGIGGMRALEALNIHPNAIHINEGHAAFALLERTRMFMHHYHVDFNTAKEITIASSIFTTHTPVPAGNETFKYELIDKYLSNYWYTLGISKEEFFELGTDGPFQNNDHFSMTILGIKLTTYRNGVSKLHGEVSQKMWMNIWKNFPLEEIPISSITNGIHTLTWISREMAELFDRYISPNWRKDTDNPKIWEKISDIPNEEIWREKQRRRVRLVQFIRKHLKTKQRAFLSPEQLNQIDSYLDPDALTIGFARRFATYKRASLLFTDMERLTELLNNKEIPLQIIIAGKAHPHDTQGKEAIQGIIQKVKAYKLEKRVVFVEDYDMVIARMMVKGCDIWLNNPIRPLEASGTSGMKAGLNGTLNLSVLDGWWDEGFDSNNGFAIGEGEEFENTDEQMIAESKLLYDIIEKTIIKMFYVRSENRVPESWVKMMKESISSISGQFSTTRMVKDYTNKFYVKAIKNYFVMTDNYAQKSKDLKIWKEHIKNSWDKVHISDVIMKESDELKVGDTVHVSAVVELGSLSPEDVKIQIFHGAVDHTGAIINSQTDDLHVTNHYDNHIYFEGKYTCVDTGKQGVTVRVIPFNENLINFTDMYLCKWADL